MSKALLTPLSDALSNILLGKSGQIKLAITCIISQGHLLIEDLPGMGKTTLSHALAKTLGLSYNRVQFTSDLLPADLLGVNIFDKNTGDFRFHKGPIFSQILLADEINRTTPKSQSALLEAMEEHQVTIEGVTHALPTPFFVIATQNPLEQAGTYPLPESQLDRFLMRISLGYPDPESERELLKGQQRSELIKDLQPILQSDILLGIQQSVRKITASDALIDYIQRLISHTRTQPGFGYGISPRGGLALLNASRSWALLEGRNSVLPDDVQAVLPSVIEHRLGRDGNAINYPLSHKLLSEVDVF